MRRGRIWLYKSDPKVGDKIGKKRPAVIVNNNEIGTLRLKIIVPITGWNEVFAGVVWMVQIEPSAENGLSKLSAADTFQVRSISQQRLICQLGTPLVCYRYNTGVGNAARRRSSLASLHKSAVSEAMP